MEFSALIDALDDVLSDAKHVPLSSDVRVDRQATCAIVGQLRGAIPDELSEARWIRAHRDEMLAEARSEVAQVLEEAREQWVRLLGRDELASAAEERSRRLLEAAEQEARELRLGAEQDALQVIDSLEAYLMQLAGAVERGRARLAQRNPDQLIEREPDRLVARSGARGAARQPARA